MELSGLVGAMDRNDCRTRRRYWSFEARADFDFAREEQISIPAQPTIYQVETARIVGAPVFPSITLILSTTSMLRLAKLDPIRSRRSCR